VLAASAALVLLALGLPVASTLYWMADGLPPALSGGANVSLLDAAGHTALYGGSAAALATVMAFPVALLAIRHSARARQILERSTYLVLGMPGVVVAFALSYFTERYAAGFGYGTSLLLIACYAIMFFPLGLVGVKASLVRAPVSLDEVARSLGQRRLQVLFRVTARLAGPGLVAAFCLVFLSAVTELTATLLLIPTGTQTLATQFWAYQSNLSYSQAAPFALVMIIVALARALAIEPAVVLLDEPFASLDASLRAGLRADVQEIFRRAGTTAVLVTHDQDEALSTADRVAVLRDGKIAQCAPPEDLYRRPADAGLASFIGDANLLEGILADGVVKTMFGPLPLDPAATSLGTAGRVTVLVRPEQIDLGPNEDGFTALVTSYRYHGHDAVLAVQPGNDTEARPIVVRITGGPHRPVGSAVTLRARGPVFAWPAH
jgi:ABC-type spermidine/putrescine transport system permease subunit II